MDSSGEGEGDVVDSLKAEEGEESSAESELMSSSTRAATSASLGEEE